MNKYYFDFGEEYNNPNDSRFVYKDVCVFHRADMKKLQYAYNCRKVVGSMIEEEDYTPAWHEDFGLLAYVHKYKSNGLSGNKSRIDHWLEGPYLFPSNSREFSTRSRSYHKNIPGSVCLINPTSGESSWFNTETLWYLGATNPERTIDESR
tara:strand:+ start:716 stop:1168 length:453 start_codon:yes stop_codon:yes gene_type:complete